MKKLLYLFIAVSLVLALVPAAGFAHTEADPLVVDLLAGQTDDIGDVEVWNDADNLYVNFVYEGPDCGFLEVHLQVDEGTFSGDILTKKGNPIPGQFEKSYSNGCFTEKLFIYDLATEGFEVGDSLVIAAHAATGLEESTWVYSDGTETFTAVGGPGTATTQAAGIVCNAGPRTGTAVAAWQHSAWSAATSQFAHGTWVWEAHRSVNPICGDVVDLSRTFNIGYPAAGWLKITTDNGYEVYLNNQKVGSDGVFSAWRTSDLTEPYVTTKDTPVGWKSVETYNNLIDYLLPGDNAFWFATGNEYFYPGDYNNSSPGTVDNNPGGLIYEAYITYYSDGETAWGAGTRFNEDKNWATYFTYTVQPVCPEVIGTSDSVTLLPAPLLNVTLDANTANNLQLFEEFVGSLEAPLPLDVDGSAIGQVAAGTQFCSYYVHFDQIGDGGLTRAGSITFESEAEILGLVISGGDLGPFAGINKMFAVDDLLQSETGITYPTYTENTNSSQRTLFGNSHRGLEAYYQDQVSFSSSGVGVDFSLYVANAFDSFRIILKALPSSP